MIIDDSNRKIIGEMLNIHKADRSAFYCSYFKNKLTLRNGAIWLINRDQDQKGGGDPGYIEISIDGKDYVFNINKIMGKIVDIDGKKYRELEIYFLSLFREDIATNCIWLTVDPSSKTGWINGVDKKFRCIGHNDTGDMPVEYYDGENQGYVLMRALIQFCRLLKEKFGIVKLSLSDIAKRNCGGKYDSFLISESNMLQGREPYYMKFGFRPYSATMRDKIVANIKKMRSEILDAKFLVNCLERRTRQKLPKQLEEFLVANDGKLVSDVVTRMMIEQCDFYVKYCEDMYRCYELYELRGRELIYELVL